MTDQINPLSSIPDLVLHGLLYNEDYFNQVIPYIKKEYFEDEPHKLVFDEIQNFYRDYSSRATPTAIAIALEKRKGISEANLEESLKKLDELKNHEESGAKSNADWLRDSSEAWVKERAYYNVMLEAADLINSGKPPMGIVDKMAEAQGISFDSSIGHDFIEDAGKRFEFYHKKENKIPFRVEMFNRITKGGVVPKTLTCFMSNTTGGFKSGTMCDWAAFLLMQGYDVLYITLEMSEEKIAQRIDANLMNLEIDVVESIGRENYMTRIQKIREACTGRLIIKEFPTSSAHAGHFRFLIKELRQKKNFRPKIVFIDYLNICASSRLSAATANSYTYVKSIAEELRGLAVELDFACVTGTQGNRDALDSSDVGLSNVSESIGLPNTCDLFLAIITTEQLDRMGQLMFKQLKNRYGDMTKYTTFAVGVIKAKMQLFDVNAQQAAAQSANPGAPKGKGDDQSHIIPAGNGLEQIDTRTGEITPLPETKVDKYNGFKFD